MTVFSDHHNTARPDPYPKSRWLRAALALVLLGFSIWFYDIKRPILSYLEYLPVYRAERQYGR